MRVFAAVVAVVATLLLGTIAAELYPIARAAYAVIHAGERPAETRAERDTRLRREAAEVFADLDAITGRSAQTPARREHRAPAPASPATPRP